MNLSKSLMTLSASALLFGTASAQASTITETITRTLAAISSPNSGTVNNQANNIDADSTSDASSAAGDSSATTNTDGTAFVSTSSAGAFEGGRIRGDGVANVTQTIRNDTGAAQDYEVTFTVSDIFLSAIENYSFFGPSTNYNNPFFDPSSEAVGHRMFYVVNVNGSTVFNTRVELFGGVNDGFSVSGLGVATSGVLNETNDGTTASATYLLSGFTETIDLGSFADGEEFEVQATLSTIGLATAVEGEQSFGGSFNDPISVSFGSVRVVQPSVSPVPLPAAGWLMLAGLGGLAAARRRKTS